MTLPITFVISMQIMVVILLFKRFIIKEFFDYVICILNF